MPHYVYIYILSAAPADFNSAEEDQFTEPTSDPTLRLTFAAHTLSAFWLGVDREYALIGKSCPHSSSLGRVLSLRDWFFSCCNTENKVQVWAQHWTRLESGSIKPATTLWKDVQCRTGSLTKSVRRHTLDHTFTLLNVGLCDRLKRYNIVITVSTVIKVIT